MSEDIAFALGVAAATWNVGVLRLGVLIVETVGAGSAGNCGATIVVLVSAAGCGVLSGSRTVGIGASGVVSKTISEDSAVNPPGGVV